MHLINYVQQISCLAFLPVMSSFHGICICWHIKLLRSITSSITGCLCPLHPTPPRTGGISLGSFSQIINTTTPAVKPNNEKAFPPVKGACRRLFRNLPNGTLIVMMTNLEIIASASPAVSDSPMDSLINYLD